MTTSRVAQWKRAGPITQRSVDRNYALLEAFFLILATCARNFFTDRPGGKEAWRPNHFS